MRSAKLKKMVLAAAFAALTCVATTLLHIPSPLGGYFNVGDAVILLAAFLMEPAYAAVAGGFGAAMADVLLAYTFYAPATLIIKAATVLCATGLFHLLRRKPMLGVIAGSVAGELVMAGGYFVFEWATIGLGGSLESLVAVNLPQAAVNAAAAMALYCLLKKLHVTEIMTRKVSV